MNDLRSLSRSQRSKALHATEADLLWLYSPLRPTCTTCKGEGRIGEGHQRKVCPSCDGLGSTRPTSSASPMVRARALLLDGELQAAVISAQHPEGATHPTEGSTGWSDPTGEAAMVQASVELRANEIRKGWGWSLGEAHRAIRDVAAAASGTDLHRTHVKSTIRRIRWLTEAPHDRVNAYASTIGGDDLGQLDHAIRWAADAVAAVRYGPLVAHGRSVPSVSSVIEAARRTLDAAPPKPKSKPLEECVSCARDGGHFSPIHPRFSTKHLCFVCGDYASQNGGEWPPLIALVDQHRRGGKLSPRKLAEAQRGERTASGARTVERTVWRNGVVSQEPIAKEA